MFALRNTYARRRATHRQPSQRPPHSRRTAVEALEGRVLLAGNVVTTPTGMPNSPGEPAPELLVEGDTADNEIMVKKGTAPGEIIVNGLNGTLVNGSTQEWHFNGVQSLLVTMDGGNDRVDLRNLTLSGLPDVNGFTFAQVIVDGGAGDDSITMFNTTIDASAPPPDPDVLFFPSSTVGVQLFGETSAVGDPSGTGNDTIDVSNTTITADGGESSAAALSIFGDDNNGGTITRGNDHINVSNTVISTTDTTLNSSAFVTIYGDNNTADDIGPTPTTSVIGEGNDWINVNKTDIIADSDQGSGAVFVQVYGDNNIVFDSSPISGTGTATIGNLAAKTGGNDTISLTNTTVSASGGLLSNNMVVVDVRGDQNFAQVGTADIGGGNDTISITNFAASTSGVLATNETDLRVFGDGDVTGNVTVTSRVGVGNDVITMTNDDIFAAGNPNNIATVLFNSDDQNQQGEAGTIVGQGDDSVNIFNFLLQASTSSNMQLQTQKGRDIVDIHNVRFGGMGIDTGSGNDDLTILNSRWGNGNFSLREGNDLLKINGNSFVFTSADGGPGIDTLAAHNNTGVFLPTNFEIFT